MLIPRSEWPDFDSFVRESSPALIRAAYLLTGDSGHAEDLVQAALLRVARRWKVARENPIAFTRKVIVNLATDRWRTRARRPAETYLHAGVEPAADGADAAIVLRHLLRQLIAELPPSQRAILVLRFFEDLSISETAETLGCSEGNVKSQTHHALSRLRTLVVAAEADSVTMKEADHVDR
ncbi:MAG: SigE family RNA polymerase sigma factor [Jatrophihabitantaceae bacterium]